MPVRSTFDTLIESFQTQLILLIYTGLPIWTPLTDICNGTRRNVPIAYSSLPQPEYAYLRLATTSPDIVSAVPTLWLPTQLLLRPCLTARQSILSLFSLPQEQWSLAD
jgi:hypothetical protein